MNRLKVIFTMFVWRKATTCTEPIVLLSTEPIVLLRNIYREQGLELPYCLEKNTKLTLYEEQILGQHDLQQNWED
jgi:hypothetical protein